jgi:pilus assembly protein CpaB
MRAITIPSEEISGVGGYMVAGDKIDILVSYSDTEINPEKVLYTQLQNIEVLEVGPNVTLKKEDQQSTVTSSITVIVTPEQAEVVAFAAVNGSFHFTLRNPMDKTKVKLDQFGSENFNVWRDR